MKPSHNLQQLWIPFCLFAVAVLIFSTAGSLLKTPGYMDAEYYYMTGQTIASGGGFTEMILWNYLDDPEGLPHPSHTYWMPSASIIAAFGMLLTGSLQFSFAQIFFVLLAASIPAITFGVAHTLHKDDRFALLAGLLALFPGYYLVYFPTTATITPYAFFGALFIWQVLVIDERGTKSKKNVRYFSLGVLAGLMYLTRADGIIWLAGAVLSCIFLNHKQVLLQDESDRHIQKRAYPVLISILFVSLGYLLITLPWQALGFFNGEGAMRSGGFLTLWMTDYNQTFIYPPSRLNLANWLDFDIWEHFAVRLRAAFDNLITAIAVEGEIVLFPLMVLSIWSLRKKRILLLFALIWFFTFGTMSFVFPFSGPRGGFLHSSAAFQPLIWALIPAGYHQFIQWGVKKRNWKYRRAFNMFFGALIIAIAFLSGFLFFSKVIGEDAQSPRWQKSYEDYGMLEVEITKDFPDKNEIIMVNNPPGYFLASGGRPAVVIPDGDEAILMQVTERYQVSIVAFDQNTVEGLEHLYYSPGSTDWLTYLYTTNDFRVYAVEISNEDE